MRRITTTPIPEASLPRKNENRPYKTELFIFYNRPCIDEWREYKSIIRNVK
jgi:hypothetical protein